MFFYHTHVVLRNAFTHLKIAGIKSLIEWIIYKYNTTSRKTISNSKILPIIKKYKLEGIIEMLFKKNSLHDIPIWTNNYIYNDPKKKQKNPKCFIRTPGNLGTHQRAM